MKTPEGVTGREEIWKSISDYPGYEVSNQGRVRSFWKRQGRKPCCLSNKPQRILRPRPDNDGYLGLSLCRNGKKYTFTIHKIVLRAFVGLCPPGMEACHADGKRLNNYLENLRWDTPAGNGADVRRHGSRKGVKNPQAKHTESQIIQIRELTTHKHTQRKIAKMFDVSQSTIWRILNRQNWAHIP